MHKELTTLLKMLNGSLQAAPAFLQKVIVQYQLQHAFYGGAMFVCAIVLFVVAYKLLAKREELLKPLIEQHGGDRDRATLYLDGFWDVGAVLICLLAAGAGFVFVIAAVYNIGIAISPITSLISVLTGN